MQMVNPPIFRIQQDGKIIAPRRSVHVQTYIEFVKALGYGVLPSCSHPEDCSNESTNLLNDARGAPFRVTSRKGYHFHLSEDNYVDKANWPYYFSDNTIYLSKPDSDTGEQK